MEIRKYPDINKSEGRTYQNLGDAVKAGLIEKFIPVNTYIKLE
jgi:hypothetical protein